jgi:hypothetical protein
MARYLKTKDLAYLSLFAPCLLLPAVAISASLPSPPQVAAHSYAMFQ